MKNNSIFTGSGVAIVTPMNLAGFVDYEKLGELIEWQINEGTDAIIICGTTGESSTLTDKEHADCIEFAVKATNKRVPVIAGTGSNDTAYAAELTKEAEKLGADASLQVTPYYNKTSQKGLCTHFERIAESSNLPIILYNVPSRTGFSISIDTYKYLAPHKNIVATKEASGDFSLIAKVAAECGGDMDIYSGNDDQIVPIMSLGGIGVISVVANIMPRLTHDICDSYLKGNTNESRDMFLKLLPLINSLSLDVNPIPVKEALNLMGKDVGSCRLPLVGMDEKSTALLMQALKQYNLA